MGPASSLIGGLKRALKERGLTYKEVALRLGMSEAGVKRAFAKESFTLARLEQICRLLGLTLADLVRDAAPRLSEAAHLLDQEQEAALAADEDLYAYFCLLLAGLQPEAVVARYQFSAATARGCLSRLDKLRLVERLPGDRVRCLKVPDVAWSADGPLSALYWAKVKQEFLDDGFQGDLATLKFLHGELTPSSVAVLRKKLAGLVRDFREMVDADRVGTTEPKHRIWFLAAFRPWVFSQVTKYRK